VREGPSSTINHPRPPQKRGRAGNAAARRERRGLTYHPSGHHLMFRDAIGHMYNNNNTMYMHMHMHMYNMCACCVRKGGLRPQRFEWKGSVGCPRQHDPTVCVGTTHASSRSRPD